MSFGKFGLKTVRLVAAFLFPFVVVVEFRIVETNDTRYFQKQPPLGVVTFGGLHFQGIVTFGEQKHFLKLMRLSAFFAIKDGKS